MGRDFVGDDDFLLFLGDHIYLSDAPSVSCAAQITQAHEHMRGAAMVGVQPVGTDEIARVGVCKGEPLDSGVYRCIDFAEKPDASRADQDLRTPGIEDGRYLAHCGIYAFRPDIFDCLREVATSGSPTGDEVQLADAQSLLLQRHPGDYFLRRIDGTAYDTGTVDSYVKAVAAFAEKYLRR
jgi:UTP--glucose-1-phosphate uridylyltransferase